MLHRCMRTLQFSSLLSKLGTITFAKIIDCVFLANYNICDCFELFDFKYSYIELC